MLKNINQAKALTYEFAKERQALDAEDISNSFSLLVINLLATHCMMGLINALENDSMDTFLERSLHVYIKSENFKRCVVYNNSNDVRGISLNENDDIEVLEKVIAFTCLDMHL